MNTIVIAAPQSGSGKTTVTLGIMECLKRRGLAVAPFKVGPDFIDPGYHTLVCGRPSVNLDGWMCGEAFVRETVAFHGRGADVAVVEGVMGLFDGIGGASDEGSTAQVARILDAPVLLVVDARSQARSAAPLVKGFVEFDPRVRVAGVVFNNVGSDNHTRILREALASALPSVKLLGCLPRTEGLQLPSRHLGLVTAEEHPLSPAFLDLLASTMERHLDLEGILALAASCPHPQPLSQWERVAEGRVRESDTVRIAVARDAAFCFVYEDNLRLLRQAGAELVAFSPLADDGLPEGVDGIYLPGGYPELFAEALAANEPMKGAIRGAVAAGMPVYAECGGFIYLSQGVTDLQGSADTLHPFVGVYPVTARMLPKRNALGYRQVETVAPSLLGPASTIARGHEFHYSEMEAMPPQLERYYRVSRQGEDLGLEGYVVGNCLASYLHLHFGSNPALAPAFVASCRKFKDGKGE
jgi:cobyrinic acid a,c-diamide synthase